MPPLWLGLVAARQKLERQPTLPLRALPQGVDAARVEEAPRKAANQPGSCDHGSPVDGGRYHGHEDAGKGGADQPLERLEHKAQTSCCHGKGLMPMA